MGLGAANLSKLLNTQLQSFIDLCHCDGGTIYTTRKQADGETVLVFETMITRSRKVYQVPSHLRDHTFALDESTLVGRTALHRHSYKLFEPTESSQMKDYWITSILSAPLVTPRGDLVGVVQLLNKLPHKKKGVPIEATLSPGGVTPMFDARDEQLFSIVAGGAALAIENSLLLDEQEKLLEGFVNACVTAVEARDPVTSGHSNRVANYTVNLSEAINRTDVGNLKLVRFSEHQLREIRFAAMLHDIGKISVKESVLNKERKLHPGQTDLIQLRIKLMKSRFQYLEKVHGKDVRLELKTLQEAWGFIQEANEPMLFGGTFNRSRLKTVIEDLMKLEVELEDGERFSTLTREEGLSLCIPKGTLTPDERLEIEKHVSHTYEILKLVPWSRGLERVPEIAYRHHEKLDGTGYPLKKEDPEIPVQSRILTICDIYDALTADDRPYKASVPIAKALDILAEEVKHGKLDSEIYRVFVDSRVYEFVGPSVKKKAA